MRTAVMCALLFGASVWADIPPADSTGCRDKTVGTSCERDDKSSGVCAKATCSRNDYSNGPPPRQVEYECLKCEAGAAPSEKKCAVAPGEAAVLLALLAFAKRRSTR